MQNSTKYTIYGTAQRHSNDKTMNDDIIFAVKSVLLHEIEVYLTEQYHTRLKEGLLQFC